MMRLRSLFLGATVLLLVTACGSGGPVGETGVSSLVPAGYNSANGIMGGQIYSEWYRPESGGPDAGFGAYGLSVGSEFTRCKSCHGWDGLGSAGAYANRTGQSTGTATRPDVSPVNLRTAAGSLSHQELFDAIVRPSGRFMNSPDSRHPDHTAYLSDAQVWHLVKFMREEWINSNDLYEMTIVGAPMHYKWDGTAWVRVSPNITFANIGRSGDATAGAALFAARCQSCHGTDGKQIKVDDGAFAGVGSFLRAKPHEAWFKIKFGQAGSVPLMGPGLVTSATEMRDLYKALADTTAFPD